MVGPGTSAICVKHYFSVPALMADVMSLGSNHVRDHVEFFPIPVADEGFGSLNHDSILKL